MVRLKKRNVEDVRRNQFKGDVMTKYTIIIMGQDKLHFTGDKLRKMAKVEPTKEHFCAFPSCTNLVTNYKNRVRDCCSGQHSNQLRAEKAKIKTGLRNPFEIMEVLKKHECSLVRTAEYFKVNISTIQDRMNEFRIKIKKTVVMDEK